MAYDRVKPTYILYILYRDSVFILIFYTFVKNVRISVILGRDRMSDLVDYSLKIYILI